MAELNNVYIGNRYIPKYDGEWSAEKEYEGLTYVTNDGVTYISRRPVPAGTELTNETYWVKMSDTNQNVAQLQELMETANQNIADLSSSYTTLGEKVTANETAISNVETDLAKAEADIAEFQKKIDDGAIGGGAWTSAASLGIMPNTVISDQLSNIPAGTENIAFPAGLYVINADVSVNIPVYFAPGAKIDVRTGGKITFTKDIIAARNAIFSTTGTGAVSIPNSVVFPEWFGWLPNSAATAAVLARLFNSITDCVLSFDSGVYTAPANSAVTFNHNLIIRGLSQDLTTVENVSFSGDSLDYLCCENISLNNVHFNFTSVNYFFQDKVNVTIDDSTNMATITNMLEATLLNSHYSVQGATKAIYIISGNASTSYMVTNCKFYDGSYRLRVLQGTAINAPSISFDRCYFQDISLLSSLTLADPTVSLIGNVNNCNGRIASLTSLDGASNTRYNNCDLSFTGSGITGPMVILNSHVEFIPGVSVASGRDVVAIGSTLINKSSTITVNLSKGLYIACSFTGSFGIPTNAQDTNISFISCLNTPTIPTSYDGKIIKINSPIGTGVPSPDVIEYYLNNRNYHQTSIITGNGMGSSITLAVKKNGVNVPVLSLTKRFATNNFSQGWADLTYTTNSDNSITFTQSNVGTAYPMLLHVAYGETQLTPDGYQYFLFVPGTYS